METETVKVKALTLRFCSYCFAEWKEWCDRDAQKKMLEKEPVSECPNCHTMT